MPFAEHRGQRIHYTVSGDGPLVVFQHGLLDRASTWQACGYVDALTDAYRVACVDSLGHGESDKPDDPALYAWEQRASDLVAVLDALDAERAHLVGYSMGGWMASGVAIHHPERLASLVIGGWDVVDGSATASKTIRELTGQEFGYEALLAGAKAMAPELVAWVTPEVEPGLRACWDALQRVEGGADAVAGLGRPVLMWNGAEDAYHDPMQRWAVAHGLEFLSVPGDHITAQFEYGAESAAGLRRFFDAAGSPA